MKKVQNLFLLISLQFLLIPADVFSMPPIRVPIIKPYHPPPNHVRNPVNGDIFRVKNGHVFKRVKITSRAGKSRYTNDNGRTIINSKYAGKSVEISVFNSVLSSKYKYPIKFNKYGYPDFSQYVRQTITSNKLTGSINDNNIANNIMEQRIPAWKQPAGFTWHHHQDAKTMQLVPTDLHSSIPHSGGASRLRTYN